MPNKFTGINLKTTWGTGQFTSMHCVVEMYKDPPYDMTCICRLTVKVTQSRRLEKVKAYLVWVILLPLGTLRINLVRLCVFSAFNV